MKNEDSVLTSIANEVQDKFNEKVDEFLDSSYRRKGIHISHLLYPCMRKSFYELKYLPELDRETKITFWIGHKLHELRIGDEFELPLIHKNTPSGTLDDMLYVDLRDYGLSRDEPIIVDKKTTKWLPKKANDHHILQIKYYAALVFKCFGIDVEYGCVLYINIGDRLTVPFAFKIGNKHEIMDEIMQKYKYLEQSLIYNELPEAKETWLCDGKNKKGKVYCQFAERCGRNEK